jgi:hypothetical protein
MGKMKTKGFYLNYKGNNIRGKINHYLKFASNQIFFTLTLNTSNQTLSASHFLG